MRAMLPAATALALFGVAHDSWGYALNAHVAICQHVLDTIKVSRSPSFPKAGTPDKTPPTAIADCVLAGPKCDGAKSQDPNHGVLFGQAAASGTFTPFTVTQANADLALKYPAYFRAGCGAPDALPFFGNTDPSHSYAWDPVGQARALWQLAQTNEEKAFMLGYFAHLAMDGNVHAFANTYSGLSQKRNKPQSMPFPTRPMVWDTMTPPNFLAHVAAESWINNHYIYASKPQSYQVAYPTEFILKTFMNPGSPIVRHYNFLQDNWTQERCDRGKYGSGANPNFDVKCGIGGPKPGMLATLFQMLLKHLNAAEEWHQKEYFTWKGHESYYGAKKDPTLEDRFKKWFAWAVHDWHSRRIAKVQKMYRAWIETSTSMARAVSGRQTGDILKAIDPFKAAIEDYVSIDLIKLDIVPEPIKKIYNAIKSVVEKVVDAITSAIKTVVKEVLATLFEPLIKQVKELLEVAAGKAVENVFDRAARDHARKLLRASGIAKDDSESESALAKKTAEGIDGDSCMSGGKNACLERLLRYPFYRNAYFSVLAVLENPLHINGLPSADFTNGFRCTDIFGKLRGHPDKQYAFGMKGDGKLYPSNNLYNSITETCDTPKATQLAANVGEAFDPGRTDWQAKFGSLATSSQGYSFRAIAAEIVRQIGEVVARAAKWVGDKVGSALASAYSSVSSWVSKEWTAAVNTVTEWYKTASQAIADALNKAKTAITSWTSTAVNAIGNFFNNLWSAIGDLASTAWHKTHSGSRCEGEARTLGDKTGDEIMTRVRERVAAFWSNARSLLAGIPKEDRPKAVDGAYASLKSALDARINTARSDGASKVSSWYTFGSSSTAQNNFRSSYNVKVSGASSHYASQYSAEINR